MQNVLKFSFRKMLLRSHLEAHRDEPESSDCYKFDDTDVAAKSRCPTEMISIS